MIYKLIIITIIVLILVWFLKSDPPSSYRSMKYKDSSKNQEDSSNDFIDDITNPYKSYLPHNIHHDYFFGDDD